MKKRLILAAAAAVALTGASVAQARDNISWSISVGDPFVGALISNGSGYGRGYGYDVPVYVAPPVFYVPPPRVVYEQPYVVTPYGYVPYGYVQPGRDRWNHRWHDEHDRYEHRDWRYGEHNDRDDGDDGDERGYRGDDRGRRDDRWQRR